MSVFPKTRAAAGYIAGTGPGELARTRAAILLARLGACEDILSGGEGDVPAGLRGLLRDLVLAVRDLAGPAWLDARSDDPDMAAFTVLDAAAKPVLTSLSATRSCGRFGPASEGSTVARSSLRTT